MSQKALIRESLRTGFDTHAMSAPQAEQDKIHTNSLDTHFVGIPQFGLSRFNSRSQIELSTYQKKAPECRGPVLNSIQY